MSRKEWENLLPVFVTGKKQSDLQHIIQRNDFSESVEASMQPLSETQKDIVVSHLSGETFESIGNRYGRSHTWAYFKFNFALRTIDVEPILYGMQYKTRKKSFLEKVRFEKALSTRERNAILRSGIKSYDQLEDMVKSGDFIKLRTVGPKLQASITEKLPLLKPDE